MNHPRYYFSMVTILGRAYAIGGDSKWGVGELGDTGHPRYWRGLVHERWYASSCLPYPLSDVSSPLGAVSMEICTHQWVVLTQWAWVWSWCPREIMDRNQKQCPSISWLYCRKVPRPTGYLSYWWQQRWSSIFFWVLCWLCLKIGEFFRTWQKTDTNTPPHSWVEQFTAKEERIDQDVRSWPMALGQRPTFGGRGCTMYCRHIFASRNPDMLWRW